MYLILGLDCWFLGIQFPTDRSDDPLLIKCVCLCVMLELFEACEQKIGLDAFNSMPILKHEVPRLLSSIDGKSCFTFCMN